MSNVECAFCGIVDGTVPTQKFYEDDEMLGVLAAGMTHLGHSILIWKSHVLNASELPISDYLKFAAVSHKTESVLLELLQKDRSVVLRSGGKIPHFHHHIYPMSWTDSWETVQDAFNNRLKNNYDGELKEQLLLQLREQMNYRGS